MASVRSQDSESGSHSPATATHELSDMTTSQSAQRNLLQDPCWQAQDLGAPMPDSIHAASACLPLWQHNIDYEEGVPEVVDRLQAAYPRFCLHPLIRRLCAEVFGGPDCGLVFPSARVAARAVDYVKARSGSAAQLLPLQQNGPVGVRCEGDSFRALREYWQHTGEILSSRAAELLLSGEDVKITESSARQQLRRRLAACSDCSPADVRLFPSGMAAIMTAYRVARSLDGHSASVQFGFPYVDTLKIQQRFQPATYRFLPAGDGSDLEQLRALLGRERISALFCESPTNPLLTEPDLAALRELADRHGFLLIIDDTLAAVLNRNLLPAADLLVTSLTKYFSGAGDVLAGAVRINPASARADQMRAALENDFEELLCDNDAAVLEVNSRSLAERVAVINVNAAELVRRLRAHPAVKQVFYPRPDAVCSGGGLMSVLLHDAAIRTPQVFDRLRVCKGPNLGTDFTLCCPYTLLAHYSELEEVELCGVSRWLLRISVGTEPLEDLWERFQEALC